MIRAFIFDVDGTLVDTNPLHIKSWARAFKEFGLDIPVDSIKRQIGRRANEIAQDLLPRARKREAMSVVAEKWRIYHEYRDLVKPFPMVKELFELLRARGIKIGLATSTTRTDAKFYLDVLAVKDNIGALITGQDIERSKPDPEIFLKAAKGLDVAPTDCIAVGDSTHDIKAAVRAGMRPIAVLTGGYTAEELTAAGAGLVCRDIHDLYEHIEDILT